MGVGLFVCLFAISVGSGGGGGGGVSVYFISTNFPYYFIVIHIKTLQKKLGVALKCGHVFQNARFRQKWPPFLLKIVFGA